MSMAKKYSSIENFKFENQNELTLEHLNPQVYL